MGNENSKHNTIDQQKRDDSSASVTPKRCNLLDDEKNNQFILLWLDEKSNENTLDALRTKILLRQINNDHCLFFNNSMIFLNKIEKLRHRNKKMLLVVSGSFAKEIVPKTQEIISTVILFCRNYNKYTELASKYSNVIDVCTDHEALRNCIQRELPSLKLNLSVNQSFQSIRTLNSSQDPVENSGAYFSYILFIELLKQMPQTKQAKEIMLNKCKDYYRRDKKELEKIERFGLTYNAEKAIDWYIQESFVYRLVNQAFRTEDVALWYLFRFAVVDLCIQLEKVHKEQNFQNFVRVYRGQARMLTKELQNISSNIGGLISTNTFLSTSTDIKVAQQFIDGAEDSNDFKVVLFDIMVDTSHAKNVVFVNIDEYTKQDGEDEVLFTIGTVFKILCVTYDNELKAWKIKMEATDEGTHEVKHRMNAIKMKFQNRSINLLFGRLLLDMNQYTKAESYFQMMVQVLPKRHEDLASVYDYIGDLNMRTTNWNEAYKNFTYAYDIKKAKLSSNHPCLGVTLNSIGNYYKAIGDLSEAYEYYSRALRCQNDQNNTAVTKLNIGAIHTFKGEFEKAIDMCIEARDMLQTVQPSPTAEIIHCQGIIGDIYLAQKNYAAASDFYSAAFELSKTYLSTSSRGRISCVKALADSYQQQGKNRQALTFCLEQVSLYKTHLGENHSSVAHILMKVGELYANDDQQKLPVLKQALHILEKNVHLEYATTSTCLMIVANYHMQRNEYDKALTHFMRALEIQKKIYPVGHRIIIETEKLIDSAENNPN